MADFDRLKLSFFAIVRHLTDRFDMHGLYPCTVSAQNADFTLELKPDDPRFGPGVSHVPIRTGIPGIKVAVKLPSRVLLGFEAGDQRHPYASLWDVSTLDSLTITASSNVTINATGNVNVTSTGSGKISLTSTNPGGIVLGDGTGNEAPIARVGDIVVISGGGLVTGAVLINGTNPAPFAPGTSIAGQFLGMIQDGSTISLAD